MAPRVWVDLEIPIPLEIIAQNPHHAPATPESILRNLNDMQSHTMWCENQATKLGRDSAVAARVARIISSVVDGESADGLNFMVRQFRHFCPRVTAEMLWIVTTCDPEDEDYLYAKLADRSLEVNAVDMSQEEFMEVAERILREVSMEIQEQSLQEHVTSLGRGAPPWRPADSNAG